MIFNNLQKLFVSPKYIKIQKYLRNIFTPHVTRSTAVPSFRRLELPLRPYKDTKFFMKSANFIMLYTGDFVLRNYVGFLQIRSHINCPYC